LFHSNLTKFKKTNKKTNKKKQFIVGATLLPVEKTADFRRTIGNPTTQPQMGFAMQLERMGVQLK